MTYALQTLGWVAALALAGVGIGQAIKRHERTRREGRK